MKNIGKPCAGKPHARFDEGRQAKACFLLYPLLPDFHYYYNENNRFLECLLLCCTPKIRMQILTEGKLDIAFPGICKDETVLHNVVSIREEEYDAWSFGVLKLILLSFEPKDRLKLLDTRSARSGKTALQHAEEYFPREINELYDILPHQSRSIWSLFRAPQGLPKKGSQQYRCVIM